MSSVHCVVVWEFQCGDQWVPHTPGVTRTLERAHAKKLTRVVLADADPALKGHHVNLRTLTQCQDMPDGGSAECHVRRACYSVQSVGGRGARWEWAPFSAPPRTAELHYEPMPMEAQCMVEEAWAAGREVVSWRGWALGARAGLARRGARGGDVRLLRRHAQPPYPLTRTSPQPQGALHAGRSSIPQQHTGSSVHSVQSTLSGHSVHSVQSARSGRSPPPPPPPPPPPRSTSPRDRKPNLARQILHNLNIFSTNKHAAGPECVPPDMEVEVEGGLVTRSSPPPTDTECSSTRSARRHSVDTVSTYLSHESKDSLQRGSVGELLNCSGGSDDVFEPPQPADVADDEVVDLRGLGVGVRSCSWARHVSCPQWGAVCPVCMRALAACGPPGEARVVALASCQHMLHLPCLADQLRAAVERATHTEEGVYIECLVCGRAYSAERARPPAPVPAPALVPAPAQPPGSMAWRLQAVALPQCAPHNSILVTYNFQSGVQGAGHPAPGSPYYAVGFPRHSVLPDDERGHQVLVALRACWSRGVLFSVEASRTTGREHVVCWRAPPPPSHAHHYLPPATPHSLLAHLLHDLHQLLNAAATGAGTGTGAHHSLGRGTQLL